MPVYEFTALTTSGKKLKGVIEADSLTVARQRIRNQGNYPVEIRETTAKTAGSRLPLLSRQLGQSIRQQEIHIATRQLATLLGAGIPLVPALSGLIEQTTNRSLKTVLAQIKDAVNEGNALTSALAEHPRLFSKIYINMVRAGEASGSLDVVLDRLAEFGENQHAIRSRVKAALLYPIFMAVVGVVVLFLLITFIVPSITSVFEGTQQALPLPTLVLIGLSTVLKQFWWALLFAVGGIIAAVRWYIATPDGRRRWDTLKLTLPGVRDLSIKTASARFSRTLASLLLSGVPLITALQIVRNIVDNVVLAEQINEACDELEKGASLSQFFKGGKWFPPMLVQMMAVGEQSGTLDTMLAKAADSYEKEVEAKILALTSMIEPVMILSMGVAVSFIVVSILLPIFEMNQLIR
ncbi:general secretion pathway protein F [Desulfobulbus propionicus DSM 2032]|uniref:General secretion pathway protein F n=1 Tax=Desulfobulbus propionicus (strain ATCC 33891 / DSM 2032 / VKM B-1956 / 1pr3) TaxID=577650 RepID=A0A7U3YK41_DESPD|nr:type II secretion system inner membrane protein GspF [Desulfobulbus propionicus]ADW16843.1 general secretion pathway protein F [Desulfobulbus propionicus DSM 2032]